MPETLPTPFDHLRRDVNAMHLAAHRRHVLQDSTDSAADLKNGAVRGEKGTDALGILDTRGQKRLVTVLIGDGA
jgi:hypothetical protein